jgi:hypothetical protein
LTDILPQEISYQDLIASQLQFGRGEHQSISDLSRLMAIKNLGDLVDATIKEMKMIEINHIVSNKA